MIKKWIADINGNLINPIDISEISILAMTTGCFIPKKTGKFEVVATLRTFDAGGRTLKIFDNEKEAKSFRDKLGESLA